jgi:ribosomal protein L11 methyltransferase
LEFIELQVTVPPEFADILVAELAEIGYDTFTETERGINAYIPATRFSESSVQDIIRKYGEVTTISYEHSSIARKNWNEEWEKNYSPIVIGDQCRVRASFHPADRQYPYEIIINPKMSFGTGHHETTALMLENQLHVPHAGKRVLDAGSGTGILAIMAAKLGALRVDAFDIEEWAVENARENGELNNCPQLHIQKGTIDEVVLEDTYDIILANINRNVLLQDIPRYAARLSGGGYLLLSGFYVSDVDDIEQKASAHPLVKENQQTKNNWAALRFRRV